MTKEETVKIMRILTAAYPQHYKALDDRESRALLEVWAAVLADYTYEIVSGGIKAFLANDKKGYPPSPGQVIDYITKSTNTADEINEGEAWGMVYKAICNSIYNAGEEFAKLPEVIQRAVGSAEVLRQWAVEDVDALNVTQSNFLRAFRSAQERQTEERKMPQSVKELADKLAGRLAIEQQPVPEITGGLQNETVNNEV